MIFAKLTTLEFMLEIVVSRQWAELSPEAAREAEKQINRIGRMSYSNVDIPDDEFAKIAKYVGPDLELFLRKCVERSDEIRAL